MSSRRPFYSKWVWKDWVAKTADLDDHEYAAYHRLLGYCATASPDFCSMPNDDQRLRRAAHVSPNRWRSIRFKVLSFFSLDESNRWVSNRLREEAAAWLEHVAAQQNRRQSGARPVPPDDDHRALARESESEKAQSLFGAEAPNQPPVESPIVLLPTNIRGVFFSVLSAHVREWGALYPAVDVEQQVRQMAGWLDGNPERRKTSRGMKSFIHRWLAREQDRHHGNGNGAPQGPPVEGLDDLVEPGYEFGKDGRRTAWQRPKRSSQG